MKTILASIAIIVMLMILPSVSAVEHNTASKVKKSELLEKIKSIKQNLVNTDIELCPSWILLLASILFAVAVTIETGIISNQLLLGMSYGLTIAILLKMVEFLLEEYYGIVADYNYSLMISYINEFEKSSFGKI